MAGPSVNDVNVPARFSMPPARPLEANASCRLDRRQPVLSNIFRLWGPVRRPAVAPHLFQAQHHVPLRTTPREAPGVVQALGPDQTGPAPRSARTRGGSSSATELAFVVSRVTNVPRGSPRGTLPSRDTNSRCCTPRERQLVRDRGRSRCTHSIAPIRGLPGSVPDRHAPLIGPREVRTFRFG